MMSVSPANRRFNLFPAWWQRNFLWYELGSAVVVGGSIAIWGFCFNGNHWIAELLGSNRGALYSVLSSICGSLFGFVIAATSIILGLSGKEQLAVVRNSPDYWDLWKVLFSAIRFLGMTTIVSVVALVLDDEPPPNFWIVYVTLILLLIVLVRLWRCVWVLEKAIDLVSKGEQSDPNSTTEGDA